MRRLYASPSVLLRDAVILISTTGWTQEQMFTYQDGGCYCAYGALQKVTFSAPDNPYPIDEDHSATVRDFLLRRSFRRAAQHFALHIDLDKGYAWTPRPRITWFNDHAENEDQVLDLMSAVALCTKREHRRLT